MQTLFIFKVKQQAIRTYTHIILTTHQRKAITHGKYEIQKAIISHDKKYFYIITNEEDPGKQNIYRINADGSNKIKLTSLNRRL